MLHSHDSTWEAEVCNYLYNLARKKRIYAYSIQCSIELTVKGKTICNHIVDFKVHKLNKKYFYCEAKGFDSPVWVLKRKLTEAIFPKIKYVTVYRGQLNLIDKEIGEDEKL